MNEYEKLVPAEVRAVVDSFEKTAREHIERDGKLTPVAFVGMLDGGGTMLGGLGNIGKDLAAATIRKFAKETNADFVLHVDEIWTFSAKTRAEADAMRAKYKEVRLMPTRIDAVMFQLETRMGQFMACPVREPHGKTYTFGALKFELMLEGHGRFVGFLSPLGKGH